MGLVFGGFFDGDPGGVGGAEVGSVTTEHVGSLVSGVVEIFGDNVRGVRLAPAGHGDVRGCGTGVFPEDQVSCAGCFALGAVDGRGVGEFDIVNGVRVGNCPPASSLVDVEFTTSRPRTDL